jgi:hypothetical protein
MESLQRKAKRLGATELRPSGRKGKKWNVLYEGKYIYTQHKNPARRANYRRRHGAIRLKDGRLAHTVKTSPSFWSYNLLW